MDRYSALGYWQGGSKAMSPEIFARVSLYQSQLAPTVTAKFKLPGRPHARPYPKALITFPPRHNLPGPGRCSATRPALSRENCTVMPDRAWLAACSLRRAGEGACFAHLHRCYSSHCRSKAVHSGRNDRFRRSPEGVWDRGFRAACVTNICH